MVAGTEDGEDGLLSGSLEPNSSNLLTPSNGDALPQESMSNMHLKRKDAKAPLVVTEVRRSVRLKGRHRVIRGILAPAKSEL
jgi:hypothetical protein